MEKYCRQAFIPYSSAMFKTADIMANPNRRQVLGAMGASGVLLPTASLADTTALNARDLGVMPDRDRDQSAIFQQAVYNAAAAGLPLFVPGGDYLVSDITLPSHLTLTGLRGTSRLFCGPAASLFTASDQSNITLRDIVLDGATAGERGTDLIRLERCSGLNLANVAVHNGFGNGIALEQCSGLVTACRISGFRLTGLHLQNSELMIVSHSQVRHCGNGGIRIWRYENGHDGTIVSNNQIEYIGSDGGNGQNGNGINIFKADAVVVADNIITECAFSAIRANSTNNTIISGNMCTQCQEVAIFSEFAFTGSIISDNIIDQAAQGISIANFNDGGRLAICANNIVRNIWPASPTNPDTVPVGIFAEADTAISGNIVEAVPGTGILAGWGPYLRDVLISNNVVRDTDIGIGASVADGAGRVRIADNLITGSQTKAIGAKRWDENVGVDLSSQPDQFPTLEITGNSVS